MKPEHEMIHARWWTEKYPGWWQDEGELALDPDQMVAGSRLCEEFARHIGPKLAEGTHFRISRKGVMEDFVVRGRMAWTIQPLRPR